MRTHENRYCLLSPMLLRLGAVRFNSVEKGESTEVWSVGGDTYSVVDVSCKSSNDSK